MEKKTILAFLLIGLILIITQTKFYRKLVLPKQDSVITEALTDSAEVKTDSVLSLSTDDYDKIDNKKIRMLTENLKDENKMTSLFQSSEDVFYEDVIVETENYIAHINPKGAVISSWILKQYKYNDEEQVQLIQDDGYGNLGVFFIVDEDTIYTYDSIFKPEKKKIQFLNGQQSDSIRFVLDLSDDRQLVKTFKFYKDQYIVDLNVEIKKIALEFDNNQYYLCWNSGLSYAELDYSNYVSKEDINNAKAYVFLGGSKEELNLPNKPSEKKSRSDFSGNIDWAAIRTKYFAMIIIPEKSYDIEPILSGKTSPIYADQKLRDRVKKNYSVTLKTIIPPSNLNFVSQQFRIYIGPLDYFIIRDYHPTLAKIMDFGMSIIRPFAKLVLKTFIFLHTIIPNYGVVLIIFSILVKIIVYPLTKKSYVSMQKMQTLQPNLNELKEKYGKDPQRLNKETMKLYKESGVNPLSGCLPTLLQLPLLWAIFTLFRNTIELRDAGFIWWIKDLSAPDTIFQLPFSIPFYGDLVNVLPLFMGVTMFIQQKMTMKDPKQKAMVYFMPIFLTLLFNTFPSGLNLYYALFNLFSILQQKGIPKKDSKDKLIETEKAISSKKSKKKNNLYKRK